MEKLIVKKKKKKTFIRPFMIIVSSVLLATSTSGCYLYPDVKKVSAPELKKLEATQYAYSEVKKQPIEKRYKVTGSFKPVKYADVFYKYGNMKAGDVFVHQGDYVNQGDKLVVADTSATEKSIKANNTEIEKANLDLAQLIAKSSTSYQIQSKQIDIDMIKQKNEICQRDLERATLYAPISGRVVYADNTVSKNKAFRVNKPLVRIADESELLLEYTMDVNNTNDIAAQSILTIGMKAQVTINSKVYDGEIVMTPAIASLNKDPVNTNALRIKVNNTDGEIKCGQVAEINILLEHKDDVVVINKALISKFGMAKYVKVYNNGSVDDRPIKTGLENDTDVEITSGLNPGDKIIKNVK